MLPGTPILRAHARTAKSLHGVQPLFERHAWKRLCENMHVIWHDDKISQPYALAVKVPQRPCHHFARARCSQNASAMAPIEFYEKPAGLASLTRDPLHARQGCQCSFELCRIGCLPLGIDVVLMEPALVVIEPSLSDRFRDRVGKPESDEA